MKDRISALMDGELDDASAAREIDALARDAEALETWRTYHVISDALGKSRMLSASFTERVAAELAKEPAVLAPGRAKFSPKFSRRSAGEPRRWVAMAAGVAAVALVAWVGFAPQQTALAPVALAPSNNPVVEPKPMPTVPLPNGTSDYLLAHHGFSPRVSLGMAPYARTVSEQAREPRR